MTRRSWATIALLAAVALPVFAHPHVFVDNRMTVQFGEGMLQGIVFTWTFDDMFSNMILADYDPKHTGQFDAVQVKAVKAGAFDKELISMVTRELPVEPACGWGCAARRATGRASTPPRSQR